MIMEVFSNKGKIIVRNLSVVFKGNKGVHAIDQLNFDIQPGEFVCFLGTTGCGKSTILNVIAGFVHPTSGEVLLDAQPITAPSSERGIVFQQHALFPWKTVLANIEFGSKIHEKKKEERRLIAKRYMDLVGLSGFENSYPSQLSGGMQQRVGIARVLANNPTVMLMDEPFGSLDAQTRVIMQELLLDIWQKFHKTIIFVTHDVDEALFLADRILILTARPAQIKKEIKVSLPRPRTYEILTSQKYVSLKKAVMELIREESLKALNFKR